MQPVVENDAQVYGQSALKPAADQAESRIRGLAKDVHDFGESSGGGIAGISNNIGSTLGMRGNREEYLEEGRHLGLNDAQAEVFATARVGGFGDNSKDHWDAYADSVGMDHDLRDGMYQQLIQAGLHDNGSGAQLADIRTLNDRDSVTDRMSLSIPRSGQ